MMLKIMVLVRVLEVSTERRERPDSLEPPVPPEDEDGQGMTVLKETLYDSFT